MQNDHDFSHAHFHRAIYGDFYTEILKDLCTKNSIRYVSPLEENHDSVAIIIKTLGTKPRNQRKYF